MNCVHLIRSATLATLLLFPLAGCSRAITQTYYEMRGAKSDILLISRFEHDTLRPYQSLRFEPATTTVGDRICPPRLLRYFDEHLAEAARDLHEIYPGGEPSLSISNEVIYSQKKGLLSGSMCLARVKMRDADDRHLVVDAIVLTESKSFREGGRRELAESSVKALHKFLREQERPKSTLLDEL